LKGYNNNGFNASNNGVSRGIDIRYKRVHRVDYWSDGGNYNGRKFHTLGALSFKAFEIYNKKEKKDVK
jgi:hypothetical protein